MFWIDEVNREHCFHHIVSVWVIIQGGPDSIRQFLIINNQSIQQQMAAAIYRQQKVLSHFPVRCWIHWLLMIKNCLIESGPPCSRALDWQLGLTQSSASVVELRPRSTLPALGLLRKRLLGVNWMRHISAALICMLTSRNMARCANIAVVAWTRRVLCWCRQQVSTLLLFRKFGRRNRITWY
jgi:hypothetical protein